MTSLSQPSCAVTTLDGHIDGNPPAITGFNFDPLPAFDLHLIPVTACTCQGYVKREALRRNVSHVHSLLRRAPGTRHGGLRRRGVLPGKGADALPDVTGHNHLGPSAVTFPMATDKLAQVQPFLRNDSSV